VLARQEKARLEVKLSTLADENKQLQNRIMAMSKERKDIDSSALSHSTKAAKVRQTHGPSP
jgi:hypothetical protein